MRQDPRWADDLDLALVVLGVLAERVLNLPYPVDLTLVSAIVVGGSAGGMEALVQLDDHDLRRAVLAVKGVGPETADDILLYAFHRPCFVIDAYTRRIFSRIGLIRGKEPYESLRHAIEKALGPNVALYNEYHGLIVRHAKEACSKKPKCEGCCLTGVCDHPRRTSWGQIRRHN